MPRPIPNLVFGRGELAGFRLKHFSGRTWRPWGPYHRVPRQVAPLVNFVPRTASCSPEPLSHSLPTLGFHRGCGGDISYGVAEAEASSSKDAEGGVLKRIRIKRHSFGGPFMQDGHWGEKKQLPPLSPNMLIAD